MDYERILKGSGGICSPKKFKPTCLGGGVKKLTEEDIESTFSLRSLQDSGGGSGSENYKDVDVVTVLPENSTLSLAGSSVVEVASDNAHMDLALPSIPKIKTQNGNCSDEGSDNESMIAFEFHRSEKVEPRVAHAAVFPKTAVSKWNDAEKWVANSDSKETKTWLPLGSSKNVAAQNSVQLGEPHTKCIDSSQVDMTRHGSPVSFETATTFGPASSTARAVSMKDMGTEMTPMASQQPSRTATPLRATTPILRSPASSGPSTPRRSAIQPLPAPPVDPEAQRLEELAQKEIDLTTRIDLIRLGNHLGRYRIVAWARKQVEDSEASTSQQSPAPENNTAQIDIEARATAWEEAEKAKHSARFKQEEIKIQAWYNHKKAKAEAELKKSEVKAEAKRRKAHAKKVKKIEKARKKAEAKKAAAEAKRRQQAAKTEQMADYIRRTGKTPSFLVFYCDCFV